MRITAIILAILVLFLTCIPCADVQAMTGSQVISQTEINDVTHQHQEHEDEDLCSPFCHCACCTCFSIVAIPVMLPEKVQLPITQTYASHIPEDVIEISLPVWQPPQLV